MKMIILKRMIAKECKNQSVYIKFDPKWNHIVEPPPCFLLTESVFFIDNNLDVLIKEVCGKVDTYNLQV